MDKLDYAVLDLMVEREATTKMRALTLKTVIREFNVKKDTLYRRILKLVKLKHLEKGIKESRECTYYITEQGEKLLMGAMHER